MTRAALLVSLSLLAACASPERVPEQVATPEAEPVAPAADAQSAAKTDSHTMFTEYLASLPRARSRSGKYEIGLERVAQLRHGDGPVQIELQARLITDDPSALLDFTLRPVRRLVTGDGTELSYPEAYMSPLSGGVFAVHSLEVGREQTRVADLVIDATVVEVLEWQTVERTVKAGEQADFTMGPFVVPVHPEAESLTIGFAETDSSGDAWRRALPQPARNVVNHRWAADVLEVRDANGDSLFSGGGGGSGGHTTAFFHHPVDSALRPIEYPVTLRLSLPRRYRLDTSAYRWRDLPLAPLEER